MIFKRARHHVIMTRAPRQPQVQVEVDCVGARVEAELELLELKAEAQCQRRQPQLDLAVHASQEPFYRAFAPSLLQGSSPPLARSKDTAQQSIATHHNIAGHIEVPRKN